MLTRSAPDTVQKLAQLSDLNRFEPAGDGETADPELGGVLSCIAHVTTPQGKKPVLKTMVTTACEKNCFYCPFRAGRGSTPRTAFTPDELARVFDQVQRARLADGLFLSSGIIRGGAATQDKIIDTVEILRRKYRYAGYVHLKIMPGAEYDQIHRAMQLADRISINLESPTPSRLAALAPRKDFDNELLERLRWANQIREHNPHGIRASVTTQFVVGAVGDTDLELLSLSARLYRQLGLKRAYYSGFNPVSETPFEHLPPTDPRRERRLYQASFLLRDYAWDVENLPFGPDANLRLDVDPKRAWADETLRNAPIEVMTASVQELLQIPGIGPKGAATIIRARQRGHLTDLAHLRAIGIRAPEQAAPYILLSGRRPAAQGAQLALPGLE